MDVCDPNRACKVWKNGLTRKEKEQKERKNDKKQKNKSMSNNRKLKEMYKYADKIEKNLIFPVRIFTTLKKITKYLKSGILKIVKKKRW